MFIMALLQNRTFIMSAPNHQTDKGAGLIPLYPFLGDSI